MNRTASWLRTAVMTLAILALVGPVMAQTSTTGIIEGRVTNAQGGPIADAVITATAGRAPVSSTTDAQGRFFLVNLPPGIYVVRAEAQNFGTVVQEDIQVNVGTRARVDFQLNPGQVEEVVVRGEAPVIDPKSTTTGASFNVDEYTDYVPVGRNFSDTFTLAPGVVSGGGTGSGNYSVSGSSGLENSYIVDGINITNTGYGGIGSYNIIYGSLGSGVTYEFLDEVQVKTGGIEAEFGQATGGVINTIVKSGTNDFGGSVAAYVTPSGTYEDFKRTSTSVGAIDIVEREQQDFAASVGGPFIKDKLFYFAAYNPVTTKETFAVQPLPLPTVLSEVPSAFPAASIGPQERERTNNNWAAKLTWYLNPNHRFELSGFGDPSDGDAGIQNELALRFIDVAPNSGFGASVGGGGLSEIKYGANNYSLKYDAVFSPQFFLQAQIGRHDGEFEETPLLNFPRVRDRRQQLCFLFGFCQADDPLTPANEAQSRDNGALWYYGGTGFVSNATDVNDQVKLVATYVLGNHELKGGFEYNDIEYTDDQAYSGAPINYDIPVACDVNDPGLNCMVSLQSTSGASIDRRNAGAAGENFRVIRARFYPTPPPTTTEDTAIFLQDTWSVTPRFNVKLGLRASQQEIAGSGGFTLPLAIIDGRRTLQDTTYNAGSYKFDWELAPRLGATFDVLGNGRSKVYANLGRYFERIPNDLAIRSLSNEVGLTNYTFRGYDFETGTPSLPCTTCTISFQGLETTVIEPGTKLPYVDEFVLGYQQEVNRDLAFEVRGIYREQGRSLEDVQYNSIEAIQNLYYGAYYYGYPDPFPGVAPAPFGAYVLGNPGENTQPGIPDAIREYKALELIGNKRFSDHWLLYGNFRISSLRGNYEGLFRNDNGQSDPNITSLFDFPLSPLTEGQFEVGRLNTDRPYVLNLTSSYSWDNGLTLGGRFNWQSGTPRTPLLAHPIYVNSGELPGWNPVYTWLTEDLSDCFTAVSNGLCYRRGTSQEFSAESAQGTVHSFLPILADYERVGRGALGRLPDVATFDVLVGYDLKLGKQALRLGATIFNLFNQQEITYINDNVEATAGVLDPDFNKPLSIPGAQRAYQTPRSVAFNVRWSF